MQPNLENLHREIKNHIINCCGPESIKTLRRLGRSWKLLTDGEWLGKLKDVSMYTLVRPFQNERGQVVYGATPFYQAIPLVMKLNVVLSRGYIEAAFRMYVNNPVVLDQDTRDAFLAKGNHIPEEQQFCEIDLWHRDMPFKQWRDENWRAFYGEPFKLYFCHLFRKEEMEEAVARGNWRIKASIEVPNNQKKSIDLDLMLHPSWEKFIHSCFKRKPGSYWTQFTRQISVGDFFQKIKIN